MGRLAFVKETSTPLGMRTKPSALIAKESSRKSSSNFILRIVVYELNKTLAMQPLHVGFTKTVANFQR